MSFSVNLSPKSLEMQVIRSWTDVKPFAGNIVAYKTHSYYLGASKGYSLTDDSIMFGYINEPCHLWNSLELGYQMTRLFEPQEVPKKGNCVLVDSRLNTHLFMRLATWDEISLIFKAMTSGQAKFEYKFDDKQMKAILIKQFSSSLDRHFSKL